MINTDNKTFELIAKAIAISQMDGVVKIRILSAEEIAQFEEHVGKPLSGDCQLITRIDPITHKTVGLGCVGMCFVGIQAGNCNMITYNTNGEDWYACDCEII